VGRDLAVNGATNLYGNYSVSGNLGTMKSLLVHEFALISSVRGGASISSTLAIGAALTVVV
jgi:hypothetical protein